MSASDVLRSNGLRATQQRTAVLEELLKVSTPTSVETLKDSLRQQMDTVTVYRALQEFETVGLARRIARKGGPALYEPAHMSHHHHLQCRVCGVVEDVEECLPKSFSTNLLRRSKRFKRIEEHALELFGICRKCES